MAVAKEREYSERKKHKKAVPVTLLRLENKLLEKNPDRMFSKCVIDDMLTIAKVFGSEVVMFLSSKNKAKIQMGLAAATLPESLCI